jgi:hypothetical protein
MDVEGRDENDSGPLADRRLVRLSGLAPKSFVVT